MNIGQSVRQDWPFFILDNEGGSHRADWFTWILRSKVLLRISTNESPVWSGPMRAQHYVSGPMRVDQSATGWTWPQGRWSGMRAPACCTGDRSLWLEIIMTISSYTSVLHTGTLRRSRWVRPDHSIQFINIISLCISESNLWVRNIFHIKRISGFKLLRSISSNSSSSSKSSSSNCWIFFNHISFAVWTGTTKQDNYWGDQKPTK